MKEEKRDLEQYAQDISTIKSILMAADEKFFYDPWSLYAGGACILAGAIAQYLLSGRGFDLSRLFYNLWIPLIVLLFLIEIVAWIMKVKKEGLPFFARYIMKLWSAATGAFAGICLLLAIIVKSTGADYVPVAVLVIMSVFMFFIAQVSYMFFYFFGFFLGAAAFVVYFMEASLDMRFLVAEAAVGFAMILMGVFTSFREKDNAV